MILKRFALIALMLSALAGCATPPDTEVIIDTQIYNKSRADVWNELVDFFATSSIPVKSSDKAAGVLLAERHLERISIYADCGSDEFASTGNSTLQVKVSLQSVGATKTRATVAVTFKAFRNYVGIAKKAIRCVSNGTLEAEILKNL